MRVCVLVRPRARVEAAGSGDGMETLGQTRLGRREPPLHHLSSQAERPSWLGLRNHSAPRDISECATGKTEALVAAASGRRFANLVLVTPIIYKWRDLKKPPPCLCPSSGCMPADLSGRGSWGWGRETQTVKE